MIRLKDARRNHMAAVNLAKHLLDVKIHQVLRLLHGIMRNGYMEDQD